MKILTLCSFLAIFLIGFGSCKKEVHQRPARVSVVSIFPQSAKHGDTLTVTVEYVNCVPNKELKAFVDSYPAEIIEFNDGKSIKIKVPNIVKNGVVLFTQPLANCTGMEFKKINDFRVTSIYPTEGGPGTKITVKGFDFNIGLRTRFLINTMLCQLISLNDTMAVIEVPLGCGSGHVTSRSDIQENQCGGYGFYGPVFKYKFIDKKQYLSYYYDYTYSAAGYKVTYERDALGRATKRGDIDTYQLFSYGTDGLVDSVFYYRQALEYYTVYVRKNAGNLIEEKLYNPNGSLSAIIEYYYQNGVLVLWNDLDKKQNGETYIYESHLYTYTNNFCKRTERIYNQDGTLGSEYIRDYGYDINNSPLNQGIPGLPEEHSYSVTGQNSDCYNLYFNEYGNLEKVFFSSDFCGEFKLKLEYHYE